ncbi:DUF3293 domain-containing protein [Dyella sp. EPa41]|uniref:DUF3293 domain-containing protein n=1 Tax=Dyella sp. EPa41 TaxID=1561194 RepID=UPI00191612C2|nr:DUF3293 domain-containing protein [Dyella sp. EPa41]
MDEALLAAYRSTDYRVRLGGGGHASIHVDQPLPALLVPTVNGHAWGFLTAWNPRSRPHSPAWNHQAQRLLLRALRELPATRLIAAGVGVGTGQWKERSLFVVGPDVRQLDALARRFEQHGYVYGRGNGMARLRLPP